MLFHSLSLNQIPALPRAILSCGLLGLGLFLSGCQTEQERRIAEAKALAQQRAEVQQSSPTVPPGTTPTTGPGTSPSSEASAEKMLGTAPPKLSLSLPVYPGAVLHGPNGGSLANDESGIAMALLETRGRVEEVAAFYKEQLKYEEALPEGSGTRSVGPSVKEDQLDGKRVVILTRPQKDGGLQSVEVREGEGKTLIQLMEVKANKLIGAPPVLTGTTPTTRNPGSSSSRSGPLDQDPVGLKSPAKPGIGGHSHGK